MGLRNYLELGKMRPPVLIYFDHLYSEYLTVKPSIDDTSAKSFIDELPSKKKDLSLSWNDLYYFELILANYQPVEKLRSKVMRLRYDYRSVAGQKEFDDYMAAKPPDLQSPPEPTDPPHATQAQYEKLLREDLKDLLGRLYLEYAILPVREERLTDLTWHAARFCLIALLGMMGILAILFFIPLIYEMMSAKGDMASKINIFRSSDKLSSLTIFVVAVAGAMGGFVSALQRIQSPPTEGDSLYNLSLLFHGSYSVFVAPITGAIFAILLYLMFTSGILSGTFFPAIFSPQGDYINTVAISETRTDQPPENINDNNTSAISNSNSNASPKTTYPTPKPVPKQGLNVFDFLARSGPGSGKDYALLIIWCFIAGFAERLVPDALDRLISKSSSNLNNS